MIDSKFIEWLLQGDVSIQYQVYRDLLSEDRKDLQERIASEGWGAKFLSSRNTNGHWGRGFYQPKWISSHYTLLDLRNLCISRDVTPIRQSIDIIADNEKSEDGGVNPAESIKESDVCVNGMFLSYAAYFKISSGKLKSIIDFVLSQHMKDGGFNCRLNRSGAVHSSLHSTISVLEGISEYKQNGYTYKLKELENAQKAGIEFILRHQLFISDRTGEVINKNFLKFVYPYRWKYDILRALDYFQRAQIEWDERMKPAIEVLLKKRNKDGTWNARAKYAGEVHFEMEKAGQPGRWNTLRGLRVLKHFGIE